MKFKYFFLLAMFFVLLSSIESDKIPEIDIFVESLCPDCQNFIKNSFAGFIKNPSFNELANVKFIPYGNCKEKKMGNKYKYTCQHGPSECYGNTVSNCALKKLNYEDGLNFMVCFEKSLIKHKKLIKKALAECIKDEEIHMEIIKCSENSEGNFLQHLAAMKTPKHKGVPFIHFNGVHDIDKEKKMLENMNKFLCSLDNSNLPGCENIDKIDSYRKFLPINSNDKGREIDNCINNFVGQMADQLKKSLGL